MRRSIFNSDAGFGEWPSLIFVIAMVFLILSGALYLLWTSNMTHTIESAAGILDRNMYTNGCLTSDAQTEMVNYLKDNQLDPAKIYISTTTSRQSFGAKGITATVGYDLDLNILGTTIHKYFEAPIVADQSQYIPNSGADDSGCVPISAAFSGIQGGTDSGGGGSTSAPVSTGTSMTMHVDNANPVVNSPVLVSGTVYFGMNTAPTGTQVTVSGGGISHTFSTNSAGVFTGTISFSQTGNVEVHGSSGLAAATVNLSVKPNLPQQIILQLPDTIRVGDAFTIEGIVTDSNGNPVINGTNVQLSSSDGADIPNTTVTTNNGNFSYSLPGGVTQLATLSVTAKAGDASETKSVSVLSGDPQTVSLNVSASAVNAGDTITFSGYVLGPYGTPAAAGTTVSLISATDGQDILPSCSTDTNGEFTGSAQLTLAGNQTFYAQVTSTSNLNSPVQMVQVSYAAAYKLMSLAGAPIPVNAGANMAVSGVVTDKYGNSVSNTSVNLVSSALSNSITTSVSSGAFSTKATFQTPGFQTLDVQDSSGKVLVGGGLQVDVLPNSAYVLTPVQNLFTITAGESINAAFVLKDSNGQAVAGKTITFGESPQGSAVLVSDSAVTDAEGQVLVNVGPLTTVGMQTITASLADDSSVVGTVGITVNPGLPSQVVANIAPTLTQVWKSGDSKPIVAGLLLDSYGNVVSGADVTVSGSYGPNSSSETDRNGYFTDSITPMNLGGPFQLQVASGSWSAEPDGLQITVSSLVNYSMALSLNSPSVIAGQAVTATATVTDAGGNPVSGLMVSFSSPSSPTASISAVNPTDADGKASAQITFTQDGQQVVQAQYQNVQASSAVAVNPGSAANVNALTLSPSVIVKNPSQGPILTGVLTDSYGNVIANAPITASGGWGDSTSGVTNGSGQFSLTLNPTNVGTNYTITLASGSYTHTFTSPNLTVTSVQGYQLSITVPGTTMAGLSVSATATLLDQSGAPVSGQVINFTSPTSSGATISSASPTDASGKTTVQVTWTKAGYQVIQGAYQSNIQASASVNVTPGAPTILTASVSPPTTLVWTAENPVPLPIISGSLTDSFMNPINGANLTVSGGFGANVSGATNSNGYYNLSLKPTNIGGPYQLNFSISSDSGTLNTTFGSLTVYKTTTPTLSIGLAGNQYVALTGIPLYIAATLTDQFGSPMNGANVVISTPTDSTAILNNSAPSSPTTSSSGSITQTTGTYAAGQVGVNVAFDSVGSQTITASCTSNGQTILAQFPVQVTKAAVSNIAWSNISPTSLTAGQYLSISGQALTQYGIGAGNGTPITITVAGNSTTLYTHQSGSNYGYFDGQIMVKTAGTFNVQATADGNIFTNYTNVTVTPGALANLSINYDTSVENQDASVGKTITVSAKDQFGNGISGVQATLTLNQANVIAPASSDMNAPWANAPITNLPSTDASGIAQVTQQPAYEHDTSASHRGVLIQSGDYSYTASSGGITVTGGTFHVNKLIYQLFTHSSTMFEVGKDSGVYSASCTYVLRDFAYAAITSYSISSNISGISWTQSGNGVYSGAVNSSKFSNGSVTVPGISGSISFDDYYLDGGGTFTTSSPVYVN